MVDDVWKGEWVSCLVYCNVCRIQEVICSVENCIGFDVYDWDIVNELGIFLNEYYVMFQDSMVICLFSLDEMELSDDFIDSEC